MDGIFERKNFVNEIVSLHKSVSGKIRNSDTIFFYSKSKKYFIDEEGKTMDNVWDISFPSKERLGFPTQKPIDLLDRIIKASCPENGIVLDPFCGSGTTIHSAIQNKKQWIGMNKSNVAIEIIKCRCVNKYIIPKIIILKHLTTKLV